YNIDIKDAITFVSAQAIVDNCVDSSGGLDQSFCSLVTRGADSNVDFIASSFVNASELLTSGWDMNITYSTPVDKWTSHMGMLSKLDGDLNVSMNINYLERLRLFPFQSTPTDQSILEGTIGDPRVKLLSRIAYEQGPITIGFESRFVAEVVRYSRDRDSDRA